MPELPEVEVIRRGLSPHLLGRKIVKIRCSKKKLREPIPRYALKRLAVNQKIVQLGRRAKYLLIYLANGAKMVIHLGMSGKMGLFQQKTPTQKHDHVRWLLDNTMELRFNDSRRFGSVTIFAPETCKTSDPFAHLGVEPFSADFTAKHLQEKAYGKKQPVKNFLMDARIVVGIGNIYANEILHAAGIHPLNPAGTVNLQQWETIAHQSITILAEAIDCGGTSVSDFVNATGTPGYFQNALCVYGMTGKACKSCGHAISRIVLAGRATFFCPRCQR